MIKIYQDKETLSLGAAEMFAGCADEAVKRRGIFSVALSGGSTPRRMYELLAAPPYRDSVNWRQTEIFWGDERCVSICDSLSNCRMAFDTLLDHVPIPTDRIHPILCEEGPDRGAAQYERLIREHFKGGPFCFDLVLLGLGANGHTASLFPETRVLHEKKRIVGTVHLEEEDFHRVTLTARTINQAAVIVFLVSGASKAPVVKEILEGPEDPDRLPAQMISPVEGELFWLLDREAASLLENTDDNRKHKVTFY